jgi:hypothetical protein
MAVRGEHLELGCWYPVAGVDVLCRRTTAGTISGLCKEHEQTVLHRRIELRQRIGIASR